MKQEVKVAKTTQAAMPELDQSEKTLYYLVIGEGDQKLVLNVGEKTYKTVAKMTEPKPATNGTTIKK